MKIFNFISAEAADKISQLCRLSEDIWTSGQATARGSAEGVKKNSQLRIDCESYQQIKQALIPGFQNIPQLFSYALPKKIVGFMVSRYREGDGYGSHIDSPFMEGVRTDLSFTLFLNNPSEYEGGHLCFLDQSETRVKLSAGQMVVYPTSVRHEVESIHSGERLVAVGWISSHIPDERSRECLFELDQQLTTLQAQFSNLGSNTVASEALRNGFDCMQTLRKILASN